MMKAYLAHIRRDDSKGQTVSEHLRRVGDLMAEFAAGIGLSATARLIGLLHDLGKCTQEFAEYLAWCREHPGDSSRRGTVDHATAGGQLLRRYDKQGDIQYFLIEMAGLAIFSHHSGLQNYLGESGHSDFIHRLEKKQILEKVDFVYFYQNVITEQGLNALFEDAVKEVAAWGKRIHFITGSSKQEASKIKYTFYLGMLEKILFSMLIDADRLDSAEFESGIKLEHRWDTAKLWAEFSVNLEKKITGFSVPLEGKARNIAKLRREISDDCLKSAEKVPGIYRLSVPTGGGKTLASMRFALYHAIRWNKKRIIVVIPYTSIIDQNVKEIREIFHKDDAILEHHSNVILEDGGREDAESMDWRRLLTERWDVPVIFTTQVQFLNTLFAGGSNSVRRLHALVDSVLVFDEIQTLPVRCTYLFNMAMNFLKDFCRVTAVLCTATQPSLGVLDFPIEMAEEAELTTNVIEAFESFRRVRIENYCRMGGSSVGEIAAAICESMEEIGDVLCIVNLTKHARSLYYAVLEKVQSMEREIEVVHLSAKMCPAHRKKVLGKIRRELKERDKKMSRKLVCISTQLIEAGVDVSFPVVYRALAGLPSIAQAAGRCNRHGKMEKRGLVRIFEIEKESLNDLKDISLGKDVANMMLYGRDLDTLLSPLTMQEYFKNFYKRYSNKDKKYPMQSQNTMLDLLSVNLAGLQAVGARQRPRFFSQAFFDAGREFSVVDSSAIGVLTPYGKGKELIRLFDGKAVDKKEFLENLKNAQIYMVNLYINDIKRLERHGAIRKMESGVLVLREGYYDDAIGVRTEI